MKNNRDAIVLEDCFLSSIKDLDGGNRYIVNCHEVGRYQAQQVQRSYDPIASAGSDNAHKLRELSRVIP